MEQNVYDYLAEYFPKEIAKIIIQYDYECYGKCERTIKFGRGCKILCLSIISASSGEFLIGGSSDNTLKIFNTKTYECIKTLVGHTGEVRCVTVFSEQLVASGSYDKTLKLWNTKYNDDNVLIATLYGHRDPIKTIKFVSEKIIISSANDWTLKIWNIETKSCVLNLTDNSLMDCFDVFSNDPKNSTVRIIRSGVYGAIILTIKNENNNNLSLVSQENIINASESIYKIHMYKIGISSKVFTLMYGVFKIWNGKTFKCEKIVDNNYNGRITCMAMLPDGRVISGSVDRKLKVWNINNNNKQIDSYDVVLKGHVRTIFDVVVLCDGRIVSCSDDSTIKIWH